MSDTLRIEVERVRSGQPRPYADHVYEYVLRFGSPERPWTPPESHVRTMAKAIHARDGEQVRDNVKEGAWYLPFLDTLTQEGESVWRAIIRCHYTD